MTCTFRLDVFDPSLDADCGCHLMNTWHIKGGSQADGFWKFGSPVRGDAVQGLAPPIVRGYAQARNRTRLVHELRRFLIERHALHEVSGPRFGRQAEVHIGQLRCLLTVRCQSAKFDSDTHHERCQHSVAQLYPPFPKSAERLRALRTREMVALPIVSIV